jgi:hypothetical protein
LILYDALAVPRRSVNLVADLLEDRFLAHGGLGGELLVFFEEGRAVGHAMTGGDGRAMKAIVPPMPGMRTISVRLAENRRVTATEASARLFVWEQRRPLVLVSLSSLTPRSSGLPLLPSLSDPTALPMPDKEAISMLTSMAGRMGLIYLTGADRSALPGVREWGVRHGLPTGAIVITRAGGPDLRRFLDQLDRQGWTGVKGGIVGSVEEAKILLSRGKMAISPPDSREKWPDKTIRPKDWKEAGKRILSS